MEIPEFQTYFPSIELMTRKQRHFYEYLSSCIKSNQYPPVYGNISYLFTYTYDIIRTYRRNGFEFVYQNLLKLSEEYYDESKFANYCKFWTDDCLLGMKRHEEYLDITEPENIFSTDTHKSNERCNVTNFLRKPANAIDLIKMYGRNYTKYTKENGLVFREILVDVFDEEAKRNGDWFKRLLKAQKPRRRYGHTLFNGCPFQGPGAGFPFYCFYASYEIGSIIRGVIRQAENLLRQSHGLPKVGEGWVSETSLYYSIKNAFPQTKVIQHGQPDWLGRQHLDVWIPKWKIAVEYQGKQHFEPVEFFGGIKSLEQTKERDERKQLLCEMNKVELIIVTEDMPHTEVISKVIKVHELMADLTHF